MAQPANKRTPLGIDAFWDKLTPDPPHRLEKWRVQYKLAQLQRRIYSRHTTWTQTRAGEPPIKPIYEETIVGSSAQSVRERHARNAQQKMNWQNKCERLIEIGIMCGDRPWSLADLKTVSLLYLSFGVEGRRILNCKNPHIMIDTLSTAEVWKIVEEAFTRPPEHHFRSSRFS